MQWLMAEAMKAGMIYMALLISGLCSPWPERGGRTPRIADPDLLSVDASIKDCPGPPGDNPNKPLDLNCG